MFHTVDERYGTIARTVMRARWVQVIRASPASETLFKCHRTYAEESCLCSFQWSTAMDWRSFVSKRGEKSVISLLESPVWKRENRGGKRAKKERIGIATPLKKSKMKNLCQGKILLSREPNFSTLVLTGRRKTWVQSFLFCHFSVSVL